MAMTEPTYRVRYALSLSLAGRTRTSADVRTLDLDGLLAEVPGRLPAGAYVLSIDDLAVGETVHWTRWPIAIRPGAGG
jgi:hypothetical protein